MAINLTSFKFTSRADRAISATGWFVNEGVAIAALAGNDRIIGANGEYYGIEILKGGSINSGDGNDVISGAGGLYDGIYNEGAIETGAGNDVIAGSNGPYNGIYNFEGTIDTGSGNDKIIGTGNPFNIYNGTIDTTGILNGTKINAGTGNDTISGTGKCGIYNVGTIDTGSGNDIIRGSGIYDVITDIGSSIYNDGIINTGTGKDTVSALEGGGGFGGSGNTYLGASNDTLKGFGTGYFYGGSGKDKILFGEGAYIVSESSITSDGFTMDVFQFENIGGANGGLFAFKNGTLTVNAIGVGTFA